MSPPAPPDSVLLMRAFCAAKDETGDDRVETRLAAERGWSRTHLLELLTVGVAAGYLTSARAGHVRLTDKGRAWCARHEGDR